MAKKAEQVKVQITRKTRWSEQDGTGRLKVRKIPVIRFRREEKGK
jgi:hypothetical protein